MRVTALACPLLVPLAEEGWLDDDIAAAVARRYLTALVAEAPELDVLVLGCTHYPLLRPLLLRVAQEVFGHAVTLVDSADAMAEVAHAELARLGPAQTATVAVGCAATSPTTRASTRSATASSDATSATSSASI